MHKAKAHLSRIVDKHQFHVAPETLSKSVHQYDWAHLPAFPREKVSKGMRQLKDFIPELSVQFNVFSLHSAHLTELQCCKVYAGLRPCGKYTRLSVIGGDVDSKNLQPLETPRSFPTAALGQWLLLSAIFEGKEYSK